jgi:site-specific DNA recombinase
VQGVLDGRFAKKAKRGKHDFAFSGLIECAQCGCAVVGEIKKQRYVYYHCTGYADKCRGDPASCRRKHVREEALEVTELLGRRRFDAEVLEWVRDALHASHADERREHGEAIRRHQAEHKRLDQRIHAMYVDKLDGLVDAAFFEKCRTSGARSRTAACARSNGCKRPIAPTWTKACSFSNSPGTRRLFAKQEPCEKRRLHRTAPGRMAKWLPPSDNHLICWRKRP